MNLINNVNFSTINNSKLNRSNNVVSNNIKLKSLNQDVFFKGDSKTYEMKKARSPRDIPSDATIFISGAKDRVKYPRGFKADEIRQTMDGMSWLERKLQDDEVNILNLEDATVGKVRGMGSKFRGCINVQTSKIDQLENFPTIEIIDNSDVNYIDNVERMKASDSRIGDITNLKGIAEMNHCDIDTAKGFNLHIANESKVKDVKTKIFSCIQDEDQNGYNKVGSVEAEWAASIHDCKADSINAHELAMKNSFVKNLYADYCMEFDNNVIENMTLANVNHLKNCKAKNLAITCICPAVEFVNKTQIDELNLPHPGSAGAKIFINSEKEWGKDPNNYIHKINVSGDKPVLKIQGGIGIQEINFEKEGGIVQFTQKEDKCPRVKITNGTAIYGVPIEHYEFDETFES